MAVCVDSYFYQKLTIVPWNFLSVNLIKDVSSQYGTHPIHWYLTNFMPALTLLVGLYPLALGLAKMTKVEKHSKILVISLIWSVLVYSSIAHKEHRFLMPLIPLILAYMATGFQSQPWLVIPFAVVNVVLALYLSLVHQTGPHAVMSYLSSKIVAGSSSSILFLTQCHGTPFYSHMHWDVPMRFLECPPMLDDSLHQVLGESDLFFQDPIKWLSVNENDLGDQYDHIVCFEQLIDVIKPYLLERDYVQCGRFWHTHFPEKRSSQYMIVYCKEK